MTSTYTTNKSIEKPANGDYVNTWSIPVNNDWDIIDRAFGGTTLINAVAASGTVVLTALQYQAPSIIISGTLSANVNYQFPIGVGGNWTIYNNTSGAFSITISSGGGGTSGTIPQGYRAFLNCDGVNMSPAVTTSGNFLVSALRLAGATTGYVGLQAPATSGSLTFTLPAADGSANQFLQTDGAGNLGWGSAAASGVTTFSGGSTGLLPGTATAGAITLTGTLAGTNGGTGQTSIAGARGAIGIGVSALKTANYTAVAGDYLACNTITVGAFSITLPASPAAGDKPIVIFDAGTTDTVNGFATNNLTVLRNGSTINTLSDDVTISTKGVCVTFEYIGSTWIMRIG